MHSCVTRAMASEFIQVCVCVGSDAASQREFAPFMRALIYIYVLIRAQVDAIECRCAVKSQIPFNDKGSSVVNPARRARAPLSFKSTHIDIEREKSIFTSNHTFAPLTHICPAYYIWRRRRFVRHKSFYI